MCRNCRAWLALALGAVLTDGWRIVSRSSKDSLQAVSAFRLIAEGLQLNETKMLFVKSLGINIELLFLQTGNMDP